MRLSFTDLKNVTWRLFETRKLQTYLAYMLDETLLACLHSDFMLCSYQVAGCRAVTIQSGQLVIYAASANKICPWCDDVCVFQIAGSTLS